MKQYTLAFLIIAMTSGCSPSTESHEERQVPQEAESENSEVADDVLPEVVIEPPKLQEEAKKRADSIRFYNELVYMPIISNNCNSCHHLNNDHHKDAESSHDYMLQNNRVNLGFPEFSNVVNRVKKGHNCWTDCDTSSSILENSISAWASMLPAEDINATAYTLISDTPKSLSEAETVQFSDPGYMGGAITSAVTSGPWSTFVSNEGDGKLTSHVTSPPTVEPKIYGDLTAGQASYTVNVESPGLYFIWARVKVPDENQAEFYVRGGDQTLIFTGVPTEETWPWQMLGEGLDLQSGSQTITLSESDGGVSLSYILLVQDFEANKDFLIQDLFKVEVDISNLVDHKSSIELTYYPGEAGIKVTQMKVNTERPILISDVFVVTNENRVAKSYSVSRVFENSDFILNNFKAPSYWELNPGSDSLRFGFTSIRR